MLMASKIIIRRVGRIDIWWWLQIYNDGGCGCGSNVGVVPLVKLLILVGNYLLSGTLKMRVLALAMRYRII